MSGRIDLVIASAGTGKTTRLAKELSHAVATGTAPERVLATTFTNMAADELVERGRQRLLQEGRPGDALRLLLGRVGTVNAVFGSMLADLALAAGRSPVAQVIAKGGSRPLFRIAADQAISRHADALSACADRFGHQASRIDWRDHVRDIVNAARANGISAGDLVAGARRSWSTLRTALPNPMPGAAALDAALRRSVDAALACIGGGDGSTTTDKAISALQEAQRSLERPDQAPWQLWTRLAKLKAAKASDNCLDPVREAASAHPAHPRLHADLKAYIDGTFACAAEALDAFQKFKGARGLVDFADQEADALAMLERPEVVDRLAAEIDLLLVDEFQDTSPIQLALFLAVAKVAGRALWVGDPKQAIYGFRDSDPALVQAVATSVASSAGAPPETLDVTYRSRPGLTGFVNDVFGAAFPPLGIPANQVTVRSIRTDAAGQSPPLAVWHLRAKNQPDEASALAIGVATMLRDAAAWKIVPRDAVEARPLEGGDIAILCRTNAAAGRIADALEATGLKVARGQGNLLSRAECMLALAGLRHAADPDDTIALAEIWHLASGGAAAPAWLEAVGAAVASAADTDAARQAARNVLASGLPQFAELAAIRERLPQLTPAEALDAVIAALDVPGWTWRWGDASARLANLDAMRRLARDYEDECRTERLPATAAGLVAWLGEQAETEEPPSPDPSAIHVGTVHRAKGLEWPVVILAELAAEPRPRLFDQPVAMSADGTIDPRRPLAGRWIRFWPWPYGRAFGARPSNVHLDTSAPATPIGQLAATQSAAEDTRLLYVAITRVRDYLVLAPRLRVTQRETTLETAWLDGLRDAKGNPALVLPIMGEAIRAGGRDHPCAVREFAAVSELAGADTARLAPALPAGEPPAFPPARLTPSALVGTAAVRPHVTSLGARLPLSANADMAPLGEALHGLFAADRPEMSTDKRRELAAAILVRWGIAGFAAADAVTAADRLWAYIETRWPDAVLRREVPIFHLLDRQRLTGRVDLVVEHAAGIAILDHKAFPGGSEHWPERCGQHLPQLRAYANALTAATGRSVTFLGLHLPIAGVLLELSQV